MSDEPLEREGGLEDILAFNEEMKALIPEHQILVWGPNDGGHWVAACSCGWSSSNHESEQGAEDAATIHLEIDLV